MRNVPGQAASVNPVAAPSVQQQLAHVADLTMTLDKIVAQMDESLDALANNRKPRDVAAASDSNVGQNVRPSVESQLGTHIHRLQDLCERGSAVLDRITRAV